MQIVRDCRRYGVNGCRVLTIIILFIDLFISTNGKPVNNDDGTIAVKAQFAIETYSNFKNRLSNGVCEMMDVFGDHCDPIISIDVKDHKYNYGTLNAGPFNNMKYLQNISLGFIYFSKMPKELYMTVHLHDTDVDKSELIDSFTLTEFNPKTGHHVYKYRSHINFYLAVKISCFGLHYGDDCSLICEENEEIFCSMTNIQMCKINCGNGRCIIDQNKANCECDQGFTGKRCLISIRQSKTTTTTTTTKYVVMEDLVNSVNINQQMTSNNNSQFLKESPEIQLAEYGALKSESELFSHNDQENKSDKLTHNLDIDVTSKIAHLTQGGGIVNNTSLPLSGNKFAFFHESVILTLACTICIAVLCVLVMAVVIVQRRRFTKTLKNLQSAANYSAGQNIVGVRLHNNGSTLVNHCNNNNNNNNNNNKDNGDNLSLCYPNSCDSPNESVVMATAWNTALKKRDSILTNVSSVTSGTVYEEPSRMGGQRFGGQLFTRSVSNASSYNNNNNNNKSQSTATVVSAGVPPYATPKQRVAKPSTMAGGGSKISYPPPSLCEEVLDTYEDLEGKSNLYVGDDIRSQQALPPTPVNAQNIPSLLAGHQNYQRPVAPGFQPFIENQTIFPSSDNDTQALISACGDYQEIPVNLQHAAANEMPKQLNTFR